MPSFVLLAVIGIAWKYDLPGAIVFFGFGVLYVIWAGLDRPWTWYALISGPAALVGILYFVNWMRARNRKNNKCMFANRSEAGQKLAQKLESLRGNDAVIIALPRGGVVVGYEIARLLSLPLDILAIRKIGHPMNPEYAIGAIDENGVRILSEIETVAIDQKWLAEESDQQMREAKRRSELYRRGNHRLSLKDKIVLLVDDGIATGFTMRLAVKSAKNEHPQKMLVAVPVASPESLQEIRKEGADEVIVLENPEAFMGAIGAHYREFEQVEDEEVIRLLQNAYERRDKNKNRQHFS